MKIVCLKFIILFLSILMSFCTFSAISFDTCVFKPEIQNARSQEIQELVNADQNDREHLDNPSSDELTALYLRDLSRRQRIASLFAEGCLQSAKDFAASSLIFQHGEVPEHFYQAFIWAKRAVDLGDIDQKSLMALTLDRYLIRSGYKQLFGSQAFRADADSCFCLEPVETTFPDAKRIEYKRGTLKEQYDWLNTLNNEKECVLKECDHQLKDSPVGTITGFW